MATIKFTVEISGPNGTLEITHVPTAQKMVFTSSGDKTLNLEVGKHLFGYQGATPVVKDGKISLKVYQGNTLIYSQVFVSGLIPAGSFEIFVSASSTALFVEENPERDEKGRVEVTFKVSFPLGGASLELGSRRGQQVLHFNSSGTQSMFLAPGNHRIYKGIVATPQGKPISLLITQGGRPIYKGKVIKK